MAWYNTMFAKDSNYQNKEMLKDNRRMGKNIYSGLDDGKVSTHVKKFHIVHFIFKYKFFVPLIRLGKFLMRKSLVKEIPKESYNQNIIIFDQAYEEALKKWILFNQRNSGPRDKRKSKAQLLKMYKGDQVLRDMKDMAITMMMYDTAYREFGNILMHEIARKMADHYIKYPNKQTGHLFFTTDIYDVNYYMLEKQVKYQTVYDVVEAERLLAEYNIYHPRKKKNVKAFMGVCRNCGKESITIPETVGTQQCLYCKVGVVVKKDGEHICV